MTYRFPAVLCSRVSFRLSVRQEDSHVIVWGNALVCFCQRPIRAHRSVVNRDAFRLARAVVQLGAGLHFLSLFAPRRYVLGCGHGIRDDLLLDRQTVFGGDDSVRL